MIEGNLVQKVLDLLIGFAFGQQISPRNQLFGVGPQAIQRRQAAKQDRVVVDEPFPDKGYYYRSDQFNFAKIGVPALYFKAGTDSVEHGQEWGREAEDRWRDERYHQPGDEIYDEWDFGGMVEDARLAFWVGLHVANVDETPGWKPGDEFEAVRQRMLAERPD